MPAQQVLPAIWNIVPPSFHCQRARLPGHCQPAHTNLLLSTLPTSLQDLTPNNLLVDSTPEGTPRLLFSDPALALPIALLEPENK